MSISTYAELRESASNLANWDISNNYDMFLILVEEAIFNNTHENLESDISEATIQLDTIDGSNELDLPLGLVKVQSFKIFENGAPANMQFRTIEQLDFIASTGIPTEYTIFANKIIFNRTPDEIKTIRIDYMKEFVPLSNSNPTNEVLINNPSIYINGLLWKSALKEGEFQESNFHYEQFISSIKGANKKAKNKKYPNGLSISLDEDYEQLNKIY